jgi:hypothetical protein
MEDDIENFAYPWLREVRDVDEYDLYKRIGSRKKLPVDPTATPDSRQDVSSMQGAGKEVAAASKVDDESTDKLSQKAKLALKEEIANNIAKAVSGQLEVGSFGTSKRQADEESEQLEGHGKGKKSKVESHYFKFE